MGNGYPCLSWFVFRQYDFHFQEIPKALNAAQVNACSSGQTQGLLFTDPRGRASVLALNGPDKTSARLSLPKYGRVGWFFRQTRYGKLGPPPHPFSPHLLTQVELALA